ncbi:hypothetical protein F4W05_13255 [Ewingella americana]|uniref:Uncharacterized protein n=1 Tax=Ewingella americana TaxID=41202 RepID=A0A377N896_9GAMM|nr:hypothetical protein [Ewingella americana]KAA8727579.1 hypothetical protein F4W05_13255 [Ewingella americana]STQ42862.1 Uncharacterised protein [Ewingella americana]
MKKFKFELAAQVAILISGEAGHVKARAEYVTNANAYLVHYKAADGRAVDSWFDESELQLAGVMGAHIGEGSHSHGAHTHALAGSHAHAL